MNTTVALERRAETMEHQPISPIEHDGFAAAAAAQDALAAGEPLLIVAGGSTDEQMLLARALRLERLACGEDVLAVSVAYASIPDAQLAAHLDLPESATDTALAGAIAAYAEAETRLIVLLYQAELLDDDGLAWIRRLRRADPGARALSVVLVGGDAMAQNADRLLRPATPGGLRFIRLNALAAAPRTSLATFPAEAGIAAEPAPLAVAAQPAANQTAEGKAEILPQASADVAAPATPAPVEDAGRTWLPEASAPQIHDPIPHAENPMAAALTPVEPGATNRENAEPGGGNTEQSWPSAAEIAAPPPTAATPTALHIEHEWHGYQEPPDPHQPHDHAEDLSPAPLGDHEAPAVRANQEPRFDDHDPAWPEHTPTNEAVERREDTPSALIDPIDHHGQPSQLDKDAAETIAAAAYSDAFARLAEKLDAEEQQASLPNNKLRRSEIVPAASAFDFFARPDPRARRSRLLPLAGMTVAGALIGWLIVRTIISSIGPPLPPGLRTALSTTPPRVAAPIISPSMPASPGNAAALSALAPTALAPTAPPPQAVALAPAIPEPFIPSPTLAAPTPAAPTPATRTLAAPTPAAAIPAAAKPAQAAAAPPDASPSRRMPTPTTSRADARPAPAAAKPADPVGPTPAPLAVPAPAESPAAPRVQLGTDLPDVAKGAPGQASVFAAPPAAPPPLITPASPSADPAPVAGSMQEAREPATPQPPARPPAGTQQAMMQSMPSPITAIPLGPSQPAGPGLLVIAKVDDTLHSLYTRVYKGLQAPPFETVAAMNPHEIRLGDVVVFPAPPGGWRRLPTTAGR